MNRLAAFGEGTVSQTYGHDNYGNHWVNPSSTGYTLNSLTPTGPTAFGSDNRLTAQSYDGRGNQTSYTPYTLAYDGDDQQMSATSLQNDSASYQYDADGQRVVKMTCSDPTPCTSSSSSLVTTIYVYDAMGQEAAEYSTQPATGGTQYLTSDHLGSTRMVTDSGGNVVQRHDYLPFGEELFAGMNGRSSLYPTAPQVGMLYTGKTRDEKTELDFFGARYFSGPQGRFTGPDPVGSFVADPGNPQSWNLYSYVRDNPLNLVDPSGYDCAYVSGGDLVGVDTNSSVFDCSNSGGYWVFGPVNQVSVNSDGTYHFSWFGTDDQGTFQLRTYDSYIGPGELADQMSSLGAGVVTQLGLNASASDAFIATFAGASIASGAIIGIAPTIGAAANRLAFGPSTGRLFYSGYHAGALNALRAAAAANPAIGRAIVDSPIGRLFSSFAGSLPNSLSNAGWTLLSRFWASGAAGAVNAFVVSSPSPTSIWVTTEAPVLTENPNVFYPILYPPF